MKHSGKILASLLHKGAAVEVKEADLIENFLLNTNDDEIWDMVFVIMEDNETHRFMLEDLVKNLDFGVKELGITPCGGESIMSQELNDEYIPLMLNEVLKFEKWTYRFYSQLLKGFENTRYAVEPDLEEKIKKVLGTLVEWEKRHIEKVEELISSKCC